MKNRKCPFCKHCFGYKDNNCNDCDFGNVIIKLHKQIARLKRKNVNLISKATWIATSEKKPPESGEYLVVIAWASESTVLYYDADASVWYEQIDDGTHYKVLYWMKKPDIPKKCN